MTYDIAAIAFIVSLLIFRYFQRFLTMTMPLTMPLTNGTNVPDNAPDTQTNVTDTQASVSDTLYRPHTIAAITLESGADKRTVRRWLGKCGEIGTTKKGTRYFSDGEKEQILSHRRKSAPTEEVIEPELVEPGAIELHTGGTNAAAPLIAINVESIQIHLKASDTTALDMQTAQFEQVSTASANAIAQAVTAEFIGDIAQVRARHKNLAKGIEAQALSNVAKALSTEKEN